MANLKISEGNFNYRPAGNSIDELMNLKKTIEMNSLQYPEQKEINDMEIARIDEILENEELLAMYDNSRVSHRIDSFVGKLTGNSTKIFNKRVFLDLIRSENIAVDFGLDQNDMKNYVEGKMSFDLLQELYTNAGLELPLERIFEIDGVKYFMSEGYYSLQSFVENYHRNQTEDLTDSEHLGR